MAVYLCDVCFENLWNDARVKIDQWIRDNDDSYKGDNKVDASYGWEQYKDLSTIDRKIENERHGGGNAGESDPDLTGSDPEPEPDNQESERDGAISTGTIEASNVDDSTESPDDTLSALGFS
jgi:hypothetical protein